MAALLTRPVMVPVAAADEPAVDWAKATVVRAQTSDTSARRTSERECMAGGVNGKPGEGTRGVVGRIQAEAVCGSNPRFCRGGDAVRLDTSVAGAMLARSQMSTPDLELEQSRALLGVKAEASAEAIKRAYLQKSYALIRAGATQEERERLKAAEALLSAWIAAKAMQRVAAAQAEACEARKETAIARAVAEVERETPRADEAGRYDPRSFDSWAVNLAAPPLVAGAAVLVQLTPLAFLLAGFHVWIHEFGHATVAWLSGYRALPLPIGWTSISAEKSNFVYFGVLFLLGVFFVAGMRERKIVPMLAAVGLALVQYGMTWKLPEHRAEVWRAFAGVGGEFYLSAVMAGLFFFRLPEKFRWGACRYVFLFLGAGAFFKSWLLWRRIRRGDEDIPYGSMIHGDEDAGGDMNILREHGWTQREIIHAYNDLATACVIVVAVVWVLFVLRADLWVARVVRRGE